MRIGILTHNYPRTSRDRKDAGIFIHDFAHELSRKVEVFVLCPNFAGRKEKYKEVPVTWFDWMGGNEKLGSWKIFNPLSLVQFADLILKGRKAAIKFSEKNKLDFLLACWIMPSGVYAEHAKKKTGIPYATWSLGSDLNIYAQYPILGQLIRSSLKSADIRFANSYLLVNKIKRNSLSARFLPAITDFKLKGIKSATLNKGKFNFLFVGRLEKIKGPDILINACRLLHDKDIDFSLHIVGDGDMGEKVKDMISEFGFSGKIKLLGNLGKDEVAALMLASDCLVIPSRNESLPLVLIEAAKSGLPIIANDVGDCRRLVEGYNVGFIVDDEDEGVGLATAMEKAIKEGKRFREKRQVGLGKIGQAFTQERAVDALLEAVKEVWERRKF